MRKCSLVLFLIIVGCGGSFGQVNNDRVNVSGGFSFRESAPYDHRGYYAEVDVQAIKSLYAVAEFTGSVQRVAFDLEGTTFFHHGARYSFGVGPRYYIRKHSIVSPFAHVLVGKVYRDDWSFDQVSSSVFGLQGVPQWHSTDDHLSWVAGVGADFRASKTFSIRLKPEYVRDGRFGGARDFFRFSIGGVLHLGN